MEDTLAIQIGRLLSERGLMLAVAESCTGGRIGDRITNIPGSSEYFLGGVQAYAYAAKVSLLGVSWETLKSKGAVSEETALEMARGVRKLLGADLGVSATGVAGPGGGTAEKPVGTTCVGLAASGGEWSRRLHFQGDRMGNKSASATAALQLLVDYLEGRLGTI